MTKRFFSLLAALHLALGPASAAVTAPKTSRASGSPAGVSASGLGSAPLLTMPAAGLAPVVVAPAPALSAIALVEAATADSVRSLSLDASPAAALVKAVAARPDALADAGMRAEAVAVLGETAVARLEGAAASLSARAASEPSLSAALTSLRRETGVITPAKTQLALTRLAAEFGTMSASETAPVVAAAAPQAVGRVSSLRRYAMAALAALTLGQAVPAVSIAQEPVKAPTVLSLPAAEFILAQAGAQQADYVEARDINDAIRQASTDKKLYVIGSPNVDRAALRRIAAYLADKNWSIVIVGNASGNRFVNVEGRTFYDLDAVDYGTGQGLFAKLGSASANAQSGQRDHAILTIVMEQRKLYLRGSDAMRANGLDVNSGRRFAGDLDQWAVSGLRNGGDVYGAVSGTVENLDRLVASAIARTAQSARTAVAEAATLLDQYASARSAFVSRFPNAAVGSVDVAETRRLLAEAKTQLEKRSLSQAAKTASGVVSDLRSAIEAMSGFERSAASAAERLTAAKTELDALDKAAAAYRSSKPNASGELARPGITAWRETLAAAEKLKGSDPRRAAAAAETVLSEVRQVASALAAHPAGAAQIAEAQKLHGQLASRLRSDYGQADLTAAQQALRQARQAHDDGSAAWTRSLQTAKSALASAEQAIDAADAAAKTKLMMFWLAMLIGSLLTLGAAIFFNRRAARASAKAELALQKWDKILDTKIEAIFGKPDDAVNNLEAKIKAYVGPETGPDARGWTGDTLALAAQIRSSAGYSKILLNKARMVHDEATALVRPKMGPRWVFNLFATGNFTAAEAKLSTAKIEFKPGDPVALVAGKTQSWQTELYGDVKSYEAFSLSFDELIAMFNARAQEAATSIEKLEKAVDESGKDFTALDEKIAAAAKAQDSLAAADGLFAVPAVFTEALPAATKLVADARVTSQTDPIKAVDGGGAEAARIVAESTALVAALVKARAETLASADASAKSLVADEVDADWIAQDKKKLSTRAAKIADDIAEKSVAERVENLVADIAAMAAKAEDLARGAKALAALRATMTGAEAAVAAARAKIGAALGLAADQMLTEKGSDPTDFIAKGRELAEKTDQLLGQGDLAKAKEVFAKAETASRGAAEIVAAGLKSLETHAAVEQQRRAETERLEALMPGAKKTLASIEKDFAASTLALNAGDASHPNANGTVKDNVDEAEAAIEAAATKREKALRAFTEGKVLLAADLLSQVAAHQSVAQHRVSEIDEKRARLDAAVAANKTARDAQQKRVREFTKTVEGDRRTMKATLTALTKAKAELDAAVEQIEAAKGDPFKAAAALAAATALLDQVWVSARNDFDAYAEVERSLQAAYKQLGTAGNLSQQTANDGIADSDAIDRAKRDLKKLEGAYSTAVDAAKAAHGDWNALDREADRITSAASAVAADLKGELSAAASASSAISSAASKVREATNWSGSYGVYISGSPGSSQLDGARSALSRGDYAAASRGAESAARAAANAIANAEAEVERHREEERRKRAAEEAARRRREEEEEDRRRASSSSSSGSSSNWGSSSSSDNSGSSWGSSSSGNSSSSW